MRLFLTAEGAGKVIARSSHGPCSGNSGSAYANVSGESYRDWIAAQGTGIAGAETTATAHIAGYGGATRVGYGTGGDGPCVIYRESEGTRRIISIAVLPEIFYA